MTSINITKYYPNALPLKKLIKYFWVLDNNLPIVLNHKILPTNNIDILFNFKAPMTFEKNGDLFNTPGNIYFSGLSNTHTIIRQEGEIQTIGVSFFPGGLYPFIKIPVSDFKNETIGLETVLGGMTIEIEEKLRATDNIVNRIALLEHFFLSLLNQTSRLKDDYHTLLSHFHAMRMNINTFCKEYGIHPRKLERIFNKFIGTSPKQFLRLSRFQQIVRKLLVSPQADLTALAHEFGFFDQAHFSKDFKAFTGSSPVNYLIEKQTFKQIMKII